MAVTKLVGARVTRVEDPRFLCGQARYVEGIQLPGMLHIAYVRSAHAHARILAVDAKQAEALPGVHRVFTGADIASLGPMGQPFRADVFPHPVFKQCVWPCLATGKVRYVGEPIAAVLADTRYIAEDAAELVEVQYDPLPAVIDPEAALLPGAALLHEEFGDNVVMKVSGGGGDADAALRGAALVVRDRFRTNRHCAMPMEGRATLAAPGPDGDLTLWTSTQTPHLVRSRVAAIMGFPEQKLRVVGPDVGGGFGLKCHVFAEEVLACFFAREVGRPVKWIEDRREHFLGSFHAKDLVVDCEMGFDADGTLLGMRADIIGDLGAYSADPWPSPFEALQLAAALPGPYRVRHYAYDVRCVCTNKTTLSVYRGVGLPAAVLVQEQLMDVAARKLGLDPAEIRRRNLIAPSEFPYDSITGLHYDSSSSSDALEKGLAAIDYDGFRARQRAAREQGRLLGIGICTYIEMTTFGTHYWAPLGIEHSAYESATVRFDAQGGVTLSVGTFSHGQGHHTTYAQMLADELGIAIEDVRFEQGDTSATAYGWGTWGSRSVVAGGGAVVGAARKVRDKMMRIASHVLEVAPEDLEIAPGKIVVKGAPQRSLAVREIARIAVYSSWRLPPGEDPGLEATQYYDPPPVTFANATHIAEVEIDPGTGRVEIPRYLVVEDCGVMINPRIVEAQVVGGIAQGLGNALYEHHLYDENGQLLTTSLMDYLVPTAADVPDVRVEHIETPTPLTVNGVKGMGEGGSIGAPAAVLNAVADALAPFGASVRELPLHPERVWRLIHESGSDTRA
ncbi:MAG: carbon monoxide dehydrogenase [Proteobacteria bacterium]|nr:MAG: carbon monoxide dehydrogenase [Pseudomonadota bacterium]